MKDYKATTIDPVSITELGEWNHYKSEDITVSFVSRGFIFKFIKVIFVLLIKGKCNLKLTDVKSITSDFNGEKYEKNA